MAPSALPDLPDVLREVHAQVKSVPKSDSLGYSIPDATLGSRRPVKILIIGFGAAAINIAHIIGQSKTPNNITIQCYEKNPEVGGTWFENKYPGCACDIPAVNYQFSWFPKPDWTSYYASAPEILGYFKDIVATHKLEGFAKLSHTVLGAWWNEELGEWKIKVQPGDDPEKAFFDTGHILINASGVLNHWKWPTVPGIETFSPRVHSAAWDDSVELEGKVVGVVGNGSSAIQIIPAIYPKVKGLKTFMRSSTVSTTPNSPSGIDEARLFFKIFGTRNIVPPWITAGFAQKYAGENGANFNYSDEQKERFRKDPAHYLEYRKLVEGELNSRFKFIINGTAEQKEALEFSRGEMAQKLNGRAELIDKMIPKNYAVGCRRPTPGNGYLECITDEQKCQVSFSTITEITKEGVVTADGTLHKIDVLVCATGFDVSFIPRFPIVGKNGADMRQVWAKAPETYLSVMAPQFPNYFMVNGPFGPYGHGSILPVIELVTRYIERAVTKMQTEQIKSFMPKQAAVDDFKRHRELFLKRTAWSSPCRSWFKGGTVDGPIMMWPGSRLHFFEALKNTRWEDYDWDYTYKNRFAYFGNGFAESEFDGSDTSWYVNGV